MAPYTCSILSELHNWHGQSGLTGPPRSVAKHCRIFQIERSKMFRPTERMPLRLIQHWGEKMRLHSLHRKQHLWKLFPSHCTSSAWYTVPWQAPHLLPPPQFGMFVLLERKMCRGDERHDVRLKISTLGEVSPRYRSRISFPSHNPNLNH
jgi:hypothetical protein